MTRERLRSAGMLLFGDDWQRALARALGPCHPKGARTTLDERLIRRWASGNRDIPDWVEPVVCTLLLGRQVAIGEWVAVTTARSGT